MPRTKTAARPKTTPFHAALLPPACYALRRAFPEALAVASSRLFTLPAGRLGPDERVFKKTLREG